ncbi:MAG: glycosyltransferase family 4 protein [Piscinibacter sp.]
MPHRRQAVSLARSVLALRRLVRTWKPDVVHAHMMTSAVLAWPVCRLARVPLVTTVHNEFERSAILMGLGNRVIAVSSAVRDSMQKRGIAAKKLSVVLNGTIGSARFAGRSRTPRDLGRPSVLFVGGQHPRKGLPDLINAFGAVHARFPTRAGYVVEKGLFSPHLPGHGRPLACAPAVTFAGAGQSLRMDGRRRHLVLPSHADPAPLVLSEAREAGCAVIGTAVDGIPQLLENGEAGIRAAARSRQPVAGADAAGRRPGRARCLAGEEPDQHRPSHHRPRRPARRWTSTARRRRARKAHTPSRRP